MIVQRSAQKLDVGAQNGLWNRPEISIFICFVGQVRLTDKTSLPFEGKTKEPKAAEKIYDLSTGNHEMFIKRRSPDTLEVQQMKVSLTKRSSFVILFPDLLRTIFVRPRHEEELITWRIDRGLSCHRSYKS